MNKPMASARPDLKILVLGAGGTGGYFGGRLHQAGADVTFLVRERRSARIAQHGLQIETPSGNNVLAVKTVVAADFAGSIKPVFDVVIIACKAYDLDAGIAAITPVMAAPWSCRC